ncbi:MAG: hypothetical protein ACOX3P_00470 [Saccharofermentanales bacterium]|jgi:hypothetical protein|nr:hypothetical protein [Bacillota bacterium]NLB08806.1 hypothetical protein [Clostridiales bacterium]
MLCKLIKLDLRDYRSKLKWALPIYGLLLLSALLTKGLSIPYLGGFAYGIAAIATIILLPAALLLSLIHYYRHLYTNQGYLTHTLPVTSDQRYYGKLLGAFLLYFLATVIALFGALIIVLAKTLSERTGFAGFSNIIKSVVSWPQQIGLNSVLGWLLLFVLWLFIFIYFFATYSFCISTGMSRRLSRFSFGGPIIVYIILYIIQQIVGLLAFLFFPLSLRLSVSLDAISSGSIVAGDVLKTRIVTAMPVRRFLDLGMMGDNFGQDLPAEIIFANDGYIDIGLGILLVMFVFIIISFILTRRRLARIDLR